MTDKNTDHWIKGDQIFVTGDKGYGVSKTGRTVCLGDEKDILAGSFISDKSVTGAMKVESGSGLPKMEKGDETVKQSKVKRQEKQMRKEVKGNKSHKEVNWDGK